MITHTHRVNFWLIFIVLIISNTTYALDIEYIVTIDNPTSRQANIKMTITNLSGESLTVRAWWHCEPNRPKVDVLTILAKDQNGNNLPIDVYPIESPCKWTINTTGLSQCIIEYTVKPKAYEVSWDPNDKFYYAYISQDLVIAPVWAIFLIPLEGNPWIKPDIIKISFNVPQDWQILTPWPWRDGFYYPLDIPSVHWYNFFHNGYFFLGNFESNHKRIGNADITVAFYGAWPHENRMEITEKVWDIYSYHSSVWGSSLEYPFIIIFYPESINGDLVNGLQGELGRASPLNTVPGSPNWMSVSHDICEVRWIDMDWGYLGNDCLWAKTGFSQFFGLKNLAKKRITTLEYVEGYFHSFYENYLQRIKDGEDLPLASDQADSNKTLSFDKGTSATLLLAKEISSRTAGGFTFEDFNKKLFLDYHSKGIYIEEDDLKSEIFKLTGVDFTQFFNDYIHGTSLIQLDWMYQDDDADNVSNLREFLLDTDPKNSDTDGDGYTDEEEIDGGTDPTDRRSCPGPCPVIPNLRVPFLLLFE